MSTPSPARYVRALRKLTEQMHRVDQDLYAFERDGNTSGRIASLRERAQLWEAYAELLATAATDSTAAALSAQRDLTTARQLQDDAPRSTRTGRDQP
jgi:hypothetical protein